MTTRNYAERLRRLADFLDSRPEVEIAQQNLTVWLNFYEKEKFVAAVKAMGSGTKKIGESEWSSVEFYPAGAPEGVKFSLEITRNKICRKVQEEKWECEPFLSPEEEAEIGGGAA